jgi:hypothetical protein
MMKIVPLRPFFVRSSLFAGWIAGGALALLLARPTPPPPPAPIVEALPVEVSHPDVPVTEDEGSHDSMVSLSLDITESNASCSYYSSFDVGEVELPRGTRGATLEREFDFMDGCHWRAEETLVRVEEGRYSYSYRERPLSCKKGAHAASPCTRSGFAVESLDEE